MDSPPVTPPDTAAAAAARARQDTLTKPPGALGRLEDLSVWVASCQGSCPPRQFERARVVVFAGDHGVARSGVSAYPPEVTAQMVANIAAGGAAINALADIAGATVRVVDLAVDADPLSPQIGAHKVRRGSGDIAVEDALTERGGRPRRSRPAAQIADQEVDAGADLLIAGDMGIGNTTAATVLVAALTDVEPVAAVGHGTGIDDAGWARKTAAVRDALFRAQPVLADPVGTAAVWRRRRFGRHGRLLRAGRRPAHPGAAGRHGGDGGRAGRRATGAGRPAVVAGRSPVDRAGARAGAGAAGPGSDRRPGMRLGEGTGAAVALPVLRAAVATLSSMATFDCGQCLRPTAHP